MRKARYGIALFCAVILALLGSERMFEEGERFYQLKKPRLARRLISNYIYEHPGTTNDRAYFYLGNLAFIIDNDFPLAIEYYLCAIELNSNEPGYYINLGNAHYQGKAYSNAENAYQRALTFFAASNTITNFYYATALLHLGHTRLRMKRYTNAADTYERFLSNVNTNYRQYERIATLISRIRAGDIPHDEETPTNATNTNTTGTTVIVVTTNGGGSNVVPTGMIPATNTGVVVTGASNTTGTNGRTNAVPTSETNAGATNGIATTASNATGTNNAGGGAPPISISATNADVETKSIDVSSTNMEYVPEDDDVLD